MQTNAGDSDESPNVGLTRPLRRTCRPFTDGSYSEGGRWRYILHPKYAQAPDKYIRAFLLLQRDLQLLFDYIEPAETNLQCYSYRTHELLLRACIEVEANCKAILVENGYDTGGRNMNIYDYRKVNQTHRLSSYEVRVPIWSGQSDIRRPFHAWDSSRNSPLLWYQAYNASKHDRHSQFEEATFKNMLDAVCGLLVILSSQFYDQDFSPSDSLLSVGGPNDGMESAIGGYFRIKFPSDWPDDQKYNFEWQELQTVNEPFDTFDYSAIA